MNNQASIKDDVIEFLCEEKLYDQMPKPRPASEVIPDWYRNLDFVKSESKFSEEKIRTVKNCMPFLDAMKSGWIIPIPADIRYQFKDNKIDFSWDFPRELVDSHAMSQLGEDFPLSDKNVLKFYNHWGIDIPEGYSVLFTKPFNRIEERFHVFSGIVDCDNYENLVHIPFLFDPSKKEGVIKKGTPMVQVIPFKRDTQIKESVVRKMNSEEKSNYAETMHKLEEEPGLYREKIWTPKRNTNVKEEKSNS